MFSNLLHHGDFRTENVVQHELCLDALLESKLKDQAPSGGLEQIKHDIVYIVYVYIYIYMYEHIYIYIYKCQYV